MSTRATRADDEPLWTTVVADQRALWFVRAGVIHVETILTPDGAVDLRGEHLGGCIDAMPRELWNRVRYDYEKYCGTPNSARRNTKPTPERGSEPSTP
ncbi:hypothetical protein [Nocardia bovistercoris]|uniref:Uncharacterized protein n=1 Tax=Nocardia bovistercoris TaxID=2785916 RepID=A0A931IBT0_9NOCA|nr:hypothetical protein [Nocardia bovistercoris]MBH0777613.1 hypothetical protein [Nocardia bovistercoris]